MPTAAPLSPATPPRCTARASSSTRSTAPRCPGPTRPTSASSPRPA
ncbi:hypothetical protein NKH77_48855 [Streptomyces sp. M19]